MTYSKYIGTKKGKLFVISVCELTKNNKPFKFLCKCDCGNTKPINYTGFISGATTHCGCVKRDPKNHPAYKHGLSTTKVAKTWRSMIARCENKDHPSYPRYGGRGISVCEEWHTLENFIMDMGHPDKNLSIDRIDNNKGYCKDNCKWVTQKQQNRNQEKTRFYCIDGVTKSLGEWVEISGLPYTTVFTRISRGWDIKRALNEPSHPVKFKK